MKRQRTKLTSIFLAVKLLHMSNRAMLESNAFMKEKLFDECKLSYERSAKYDKMYSRVFTEEIKKKL